MCFVFFQQTSPKHGSHGSESKIGSTFWVYNVVVATIQDASHQQDNYIFFVENLHKPSFATVTECRVDVRYIHIDTYYIHLVVGEYTDVSSMFRNCIELHITRLYISH